jgi:hypothetical protein
MTSNLCTNPDCHSFQDERSGTLGLCTSCLLAHLMSWVARLETELSAVIRAERVVIVPREES